MKRLEISTSTTLVSFKWLPKELSHSTMTYSIVRRDLFISGSTTLGYTTDLGSPSFGSNKVLAKLLNRSKFSVGDGTSSIQRI